MKKLLLVSVAGLAGLSLCASQEPAIPSIAVNGLRASSEIPIIVAATKKAKKRNSSAGSSFSSGSSGSSPTGAEHLFPGQSGAGSLQYHYAPVNFSEGFHGRFK